MDFKTEREATGARDRGFVKEDSKARKEEDMEK